MKSDAPIPSRVSIYVIFLFASQNCPPSREKEKEDNFLVTFATFPIAFLRKFSLWERKKKKEKENRLKKSYQLTKGTYLYFSPPLKLKFEVHARPDPFPFPFIFVILWGEPGDCHGISRIWDRRVGAFRFNTHHSQ